MSNRTVNTHRRDMRPVTPVVRIGRNAAGAAITAGILVGGGSAALADGQPQSGTGNVAAPEAAAPAAAVAIPTVASPAADATTAVYGNGIEAADLAVKAPEVKKAAAPKVAEDTEAKQSKATDKKAAEDDEQTVSAAKGTSKAASSEDDESEETSSKSSKKTSDDEATASDDTKETPAKSAAGSSIVDTARQGIGVRYVWAGTSTSGWDCSGFTAWVYKQHGITLPHSAAEQKNSGTIVSRSEAQPGDLAYTPGHVGIYAGNGKIIDAGTSAKTTSERQMWSADWTFVHVG